VRSTALEAGAHILDGVRAHPEDCHTLASAVHRIHITTDAPEGLTKEAVLAAYWHLAWAAESSIGAQHDHTTRQLERTSSLLPSEYPAIVLSWRDASDLSVCVYSLREVVLLDHTLDISEHLAVVAVVSIRLWRRHG
jgi:hypothetical protein